MIPILFSVIILSFLVTFINASYAKMADNSTYDIFKMSLYLLPLQYLVSIGYAYYYSRGIQYLSYGTLTVSAYPITIGMGIIVGHFFFKNHSFTTYEILGTVFMIIGLCFFSLNKIQGVS